MTTTLPNQIAALRAKAKEIRHLEDLAERAQADREARKQELEAAAEAGKQAAAERREAKMRAEALASWTRAGGSEKDFESAWPALRAEILTRRTLAGLGPEAGDRIEI